MTTDAALTRRPRQIVIWWTVTTGATIAACALYAVQIASGISVRHELRRTCDPHPPLEIAQYFWVTMLLSAVGLVAAVVAMTSTPRRVARFAALFPALLCGALFY